MRRISFSLLGSFFVLGIISFTIVYSTPYTYAQQPTFGPTCTEALYPTNTAKPPTSTRAPVVTLPQTGSTEIAMGVFAGGLALFILGISSYVLAGLFSSPRK